MTQPRGQQVKSVNARYSVLRYSVTPGTASTSLSSGLFPYAPGGAAEDVPGRVTGTVSGAIPVLGGDTISVRIDGAPAVLVVLASTDTTVGRIALKVNAALALSVASSVSGFLVLSSTTLGSGSSVEIADGTPGMLAKLGMTPGVYSGKTAPSDGLVTLSQDGLGGIAPLATVDGKNVVTDGGKLVYFTTTDGGAGRALLQLTPGGVPITARTAISGSNVIPQYFAKMVDRVRVRSLGSFFSLLDNTNTLTLGVNAHTFPVGFPSGPYTRDQVLDLINAAYATTLGITDTWARADGTNPIASPTGVLTVNLTGTVFNIEVDGVSHQVTFSSNPANLLALKAVIESAAPDCTVRGTPDANLGPYLYIRSNNANGRTSSLRLYAGSESAGDANSARALSLLGIRAGFYGGCYVADQYGPDEIEIFSSYRGDGLGSHPNVTVSGSGPTLVRSGLTAGTYSPVAPSYVPVPLPFMTANESLAQGYDVLMAYESVLEFGDVPETADVVLQQYLAKSAGTNVYPGNHVIYVHQNGKMDAGTTSRGFFDTGKPIVMSPDGILSPDAGGSQQAVGELHDLDNIVRQIVTLNLSEIVQSVIGPALSSPIIRTPLGPSSGEATPVPYMRMYADPTGAGVSTGRGFRFFTEGVSSGAISAALEDDPTAVLSARQAALTLYGGRSLVFDGSEGRIADLNTLASGDTSGYVRFSSGSLWDNYLWLGGAPTFNNTPINYNLLRSVNARFEVYVGDGTNSFGDFTGPTAITQAINYLIAQGVSSCRILVKPGTYTVSASQDLSSFLDFSIEGFFDAFNTLTTSLTTIVFANGFDGFTGGTLRSLVFKNVKVIVQSDFCCVNAQAKYFLAEGCLFSSAVRVQDASFCRFDHVSSTGTILGSVRLVYTDAAVTAPSTSINATVEIVDSEMVGGGNAPILSIVDSMTAKLITFENVLLEDSVFTTGNLSVTANVINSTEGVGVLGISPTHNTYRPNQPGFIFENISIRRVDIVAGTIGGSGSYGPSAIWLTPRGTAANLIWDSGDTTTPLGYAAYLKNVTVEDVDVDIFADSTFLVTGFQSPPVAIAGTGIRADNSLAFFHGGVLRVDGLTVRANGGKGGSGTASLAQFLGDPYNNTGYPDPTDSASSGLIVLAGQTVDARNIAAVGTVDTSINSTLTLCSYGVLKVDGFTEEPTVSAVGLSPENRVIIRDAGDSQFDLSNFYINGGFNSGQWCLNAIVKFEASTDRRIYKRFANFNIAAFLGIGGNAIHVSVDGIARTFYPNRGGGITIENGYIGNYGSALVGFSIGIRADASASPSNQIGNLTIRNVVVDSCSLWGITIFSGKQQYTISVEKCDVRFCGQSTVSSGVKYLALRSDGLLPDSTPVAYIGLLNFRDNYVGFCNTNAGGYYRAQINIRDAGPFSYPNIVNFYGNQTNASAYDWSYANLTANASTTLTSLSPGSGYQDAVKGAETGYTGQVGSFFTTGQGRIWLSGNTMIHNNCYLMSDISDTD